MPLPPNQLPKINVEGMPADFNIHYSNLVDRVNSLLGYNGPVKFGDHLDLGGRRIMNVGTPVDETDALPSGVAKSQYSAEVLRPELESNGSQPLRTMRRLNDQNQREQQSSHLNDLMSTVPSANEVFPTVTPSGGGVMVSIPAAIFTFADGSATKLMARTDMLSLPAQYAITNITVVGSAVTITTGSASGLTAGQIAVLVGVNPAVYNGTFQLTGATPPNTLFLNNPAAGAAYVSGGYVQTSSVYYYGVQKRSQKLILFGPYVADTASNRLQVNFDGYQIVAVIVLTNSGGQVESSGGGGTPITGSPASGSFF